jgi:eukaryotic-like serine/threonine-protein kinase
LILQQQIRAQLCRILASSAFEQADRARAFLGFVVITSLEGRASEIKESVIAVEALARTTSFDPKSDPIVRVEAGRLRNRLKVYYDSEGSNDPILITLPKGGYVPEFAERTQLAQSATRRNPLVMFAAGMLCGLVLTAIGLMLFREAHEPGEMLRLSLLPPPGSTIESSRISPDGKMIALTVLQQNRTMLWVRSLDSAEPRVIPGTERASLPFWSPDSKSLAFFSTDKLRRIELAGGPVQEICPASIPLGGGSWSRNGAIVFSPRPEGVLFQVPATGGKPQPVTTLDQSRGESIHSFPEFLPDGRHFLYLARSGRPDGTALRVASIDSMDSRIVLEGGANATYALPARGKPGSLLFYFQGALMAQPFDPDRMTLSGGRTLVASEVFYRRGRADFSVSTNNILAYRPATRKNLQLGWFDRAGRFIENVGAHNDYFALRLSPDDKRLSFSDEEELSWNSPIWIMELERGLVSRASSTLRPSFLPLWSPDGTEILYSSGNEQGMQLLRQPLYSSQPKTVLDTPGSKFLTDWSTNGRFVAYFTPWPDFARLKIVVLDLKNPGPDKNSRAFFLESQYNEAEAVFSPESNEAGPRWIAYTSTETGRPEVYVRSFPKGDRKWQISNGGAWQPLWRRDGRELFFLSQDGVLMAADMSAGPRFDAGVPHPLFRTTIPPYAGPPEVPANTYAVSHDGQRFLVNQTLDDASRGAISVVTHWQTSRP